MGRKWKREVERRLARLEAGSECGCAENASAEERLLDEYLNGVPGGEQKKGERYGIRTNESV